MELEGTVTATGTVLDDGTALSVGTRVRVVEPNEVNPSSAATDLGRRLLRLAGTANDLPADMADQHDHYLHGRPKR